MIPSDPLLLSIYLVKTLEIGQQAAGRVYQGILPIESNYNDVRQALQNSDQFVSETEHQRKIEFRLSPQFFFDLNELLSGVGRRIEVSAKFYIANIDYLHSDSNSVVPLVISSYIQITKLYGSLRKIADHEILIGSNLELVFLQNEKIVITPDYSSADLAKLEKVSEFGENFISSQTHKEQKKTIVKTVIFEMFSGRKSIPLAELIEKFSIFFDRVENSYQLYVSEFSFQKIKEQVEKEKLEFTTKLNKVFSEIQNQLLAVPAALILVGGQLESEGNWSTKNLLIWLGALIFSIFMDMLIRNQYNSLQAIKYEMDYQWQQIIGKHKTVANQFTATYLQLEIRYNHQKSLLKVVSFLVALSLGIPSGMLIWYSSERDVAILAYETSCLIGFILSVVWFAYCHFFKKT